MKYNHMVTLIGYLLLAVFMVVPILMNDALATDGSKTDVDVMEKKRPPIDQKAPAVFGTASFGLG